MAASQGFQELLVEVQRMVPSSFGAESWYIIVAANLVAAGRGDMFGALFEHAIAKPGSGPSYRAEVSARLREVIIKSWTLVGMPRAIAASYSLQSADTSPVPESTRRAELAAKPEQVLPHGQAWFEQAFQELEPKIFARFTNHKELEWTLRYVVYGLFLGDLTVVTAKENEFIVLASVLPAGGSPPLTHMKVLQQLGVSEEEGDIFLDASKKISQWAQIDTSTWPSYRK